jgi:SAM-dependent methyltransferase
MKLYDLITFKKSLEANLDTADVCAAVERLTKSLGDIKHQSVLAPGNTEYVDQLIAHYQNLLPEINITLESKKSKIAEINNIITDESHKLFANSYDLETHNGGYEHVRDQRKIKLHEDTEQLIKQRIMLYTNWRYPALEIGCREGEWTQYMVAADPLYIVDQFPEFLRTANEQFPEPYQERLRKYLIKKETHDLSALPTGQFAFVFSWGYFNYISLDTFTQVIRQLSTLMRPGGVFLFSYNDGDTPNGMGLAENFGQSYLPKSLLIPTCQGVGLEVVAEYSPETNVHWLEVRKPGVLHTVKAHQVLGKIQRREDTEIN